MFKCKLQIDGEKRKLTNQVGINLKDLNDLLSKLIKCLGDRSNTLTLSEIENSSYSPAFVTSEEIDVDRFNAIHEAVSENELENLAFEERDYAQTLNKILFERGLYLIASNSRDEKSYKLSGITKIDTKSYYYAINSITGVILSIHGKNELNPHIFVKTNKGDEYSIYVNREQELSLKQYYKTGNITFRIRTKVDISSGKNLQTNLLDFTPLNDSTLFSNIAHVKENYGDIFKNIEDSAKLLQNLRNQ